jgi:hypothetical protein
MIAFHKVVQKTGLVGESVLHMVSASAGEACHGMARIPASRTDRPAGVRANSSSQG